MLDEFIKKNKETFREIIFAFEKRGTGDSTVSIINRPNKETGSVLKKHIRKILPEYKRLDIDLKGKKFTSLVRFLEKELPAEVFENNEIEHIINISGLENHAIEEKIDKEGNLKFSVSEKIKIMNFQRSQLFDIIPAILILYIDDYTVKKIQDEALDLWSWMNFYFEFESVIDEKETYKFVENLNYKPTPHFDEKRLVEIERLKKQLTELNKIKLEAIRDYKDKINLLLLLSKELTEIRKFEESNEHLINALNLIDKLKTIVFLKDTVLSRLGINYYELRIWDKAIYYFTEEFELYKKTDSLSKIWKTYNRTGLVYREQMKYKEAIENFNKSIEWCKKTDNFSKLESPYINIGGTYHAMERYNQAIEYFEKTISISNKYKDNEDYGIARAYSNIGIVKRDQEEFEEAIKFQKKAIEKYKEKYPSEVGNCYNHIADILNEQEKREEAINYYIKAINKNEETNNLSKIGRSYYKIGEIYTNINNFEKSIENYKKAIEKDEETNNFSVIGEYFSSIGIAYFNLRKYDDAMKNLLESVDFDKKTNNFKYTSGTFNLIGNTVNEKLNNKKSIKFYENLITEYNETNKKRLLGFVYQELFLFYEKNNKIKKAIECYEKEIEYKAEYSLKYGLGDSHSIRAGLYEHEDDEQNAFKYYVKALENYIQFGDGKLVDNTIKWLEPSIEECEDEALKNKAIRLLEEKELRSVDN